MRSNKSEIIEKLFDARWDPVTSTLANALVTLEHVVDAIREHSASHPDRRLSDRNPANFFKDFVRKKASANKNWPASVLVRGYTGRQVTGDNACFEFVRLTEGETVAFPPISLAGPGSQTPRHRIESTSLPLASRRLGRADEPWLVQVLVRLRVIETHLALFSTRRIVQIDHLQMSVKLRRAEIDALFLAIEEVNGSRTQEVIVCCEAKGRSDDILEDQVLSQVEAVFGSKGITQDLVIPVAIKARAPSEVWVLEFETVSRSEVASRRPLVIASEAIYELVPPVPGIGE